jgi:hypothetical protein
MSGLTHRVEPCEVCGEPSVGQFPEGGSYLCARHLKDFKWKEDLSAELNHVVGTWADGHKLTDAETVQALEATGGELERRVKENAPPRRPARTDHFIELTMMDPALVLAAFHVLRNEALIAGFPDIWPESIHLKIEVSGDDRRLDELRERIDALWMGAYLTSSETLPRRR